MMLSLPTIAMLAFAISMRGCMAPGSWQRKLEQSVTWRGGGEESVKPVQGRQREQ